jgi:hypothetical protein
MRSVDELKKEALADLIYSEEQRVKDEISLSKKEWLNQLRRLENTKPT